MRRIALAAALALCALGSIAAESWAEHEGRRVYVGVDLFGGTPSASADVFRSGFFGASLRYMVTPEIGVGFDYAFMDIEYYYPESAAGPWTGPVPWSSVPERFGDLRDSWIFYHTKHFLAPQAWFIASLEDLGAPLAIRVGGGPAISFLIPNEAAEYYPGLADAFSVFSQSFETYLGFALRLGIEYKPFEYVRLGAEYLFVVDSAAAMASDIGSLGWKYVDRAGNFVLFAGVRI